MTNTTLEVVNACSGLNTLISVLALGPFWCYLMFKRNLRRLIFGFLLIPIDIVANAIRMTLTALISNFYTIEITHGLHHEFTGTIFVVAITLALIIFTTRLIKFI